MSALATNYLTPTGREEAWRFTPLKRLAGLHDNSTKVMDHISIAAKAQLPNGVLLAIADASEFPLLTPAPMLSLTVLDKRLRRSQFLPSQRSLNLLKVFIYLAIVRPHLR